MIIHNCEQRSEAWHQLHVGRFTASDFDALMANTRDKSGWSDTQRKIIYRVAAERMTGIEKTIRQSAAMGWGEHQEADAIAAYSIYTGAEVTPVGFVERDDWIGCSPDGLIGDDGLVETKCPETETHLYYRNSPNEFSNKYIYQVQGQMWITERKRCDLVSYDKRVKDIKKQMYIVFTPRDDEKIADLKYRLGAAIEYAKKIMEA